ncbi:MAG: PEFG-CTERM domain-containing protein, partial [Thaumarchaeota archaeon]|nr:PEFG-CTERM domain-containing protein [Nitrososphaerota archaeon]
MNFKYTATSMMLVLIAVSAVSMTHVQQDVFAQGTGMAIVASAEEGSDTILVKGQTTSVFGDITLRVTTPSGTNVVGIAQESPDQNGNFDATFVVGDLWIENGYYSIKAQQSESSFFKPEVFVEVIDGMTVKTTSIESNIGDGILGKMDTTIAAGLSITANAVIGSTTIGITGTTDKMGTPVTLVVTEPNGDRVTVDQISPDRNGNFATDIETGGPLWNENGDYTVSAQQGDDPKYQDSVTVEIEDGVIVPEFGTIA